MFGMTIPFDVMRPMRPAVMRVVLEAAAVNLFSGAGRDLRMRIVWLSIMAALVCHPARAHAKNFGVPRTDVHAIIVHTISGPSCTAGRVVYSRALGNAQRWKLFFDLHPFLGVHYVVDREGTVASSTPEDQIANHALGNNEGT